MIVGLEFAPGDDLVDCRIFESQAAGALWTHRGDRPRRNVRSLYLASLQGIPRGAAPAKIATRALRKGRLVADTEIEVAA